MKPIQRTDWLVMQLPQAHWENVRHLNRVFVSGDVFPETLEIQNIVRRCIVRPVLPLKVLESDPDNLPGVILHPVNAKYSTLPHTVITFGENLKEVIHLLDADDGSSSSGDGLYEVTLKEDGGNDDNSPGHDDTEPRTNADIWNEEDPIDVSHSDLFTHGS